MKSVLFAITMTVAQAALAISTSNPVGGGSAGVGGLKVTVKQSFQLSSGIVVSNSNDISSLSFRSAALAKGSQMFLTVKGKKHKFKLNQRAYIDYGYPVVTGNATGAGSTGQGVGVDVTQNYSAYSPQLSYHVKTNTCYGSSIEVCRDFSHNGYGYECASGYPEGTETVEVEKSVQDLPAAVRLLQGGRVVARIGYMTKDFNEREIRTIDYCDADMPYNVRSKRRELRERLFSMYGTPKTQPEGKKPGKGKGKGKKKKKIKKH